MLKFSLGIISGFVAWVTVGFLGLVALKLSWPEYASAIETFSFSTPMLLARLVVGVLSSFAAGWAAYFISKMSKSVWVLAVLLLAYASYMHFFVIWDNFPGWFHFSYILPLLPLIIFGGHFEKTRMAKNNHTNVSVA